MKAGDNDGNKECESRNRCCQVASGVLAWAFRGRTGDDPRGTDHLLDGDEEAQPFKTVNFLIFDDGTQWKAAVKFFQDPGDLHTLLHQSVILAYEVVQEAKSADAQD